VRSSEAAGSGLRGGPGLRAAGILSPGFPGGLFGIPPARPDGPPKPNASLVAFHLQAPWASFHLLGKQGGVRSGVVIQWRCPTGRVTGVQNAEQSEGFPTLARIPGRSQGHRRIVNPSSRPPQASQHSQSLGRPFFRIQVSLQVQPYTSSVPSSDTLAAELGTIHPRLTVNAQLCDSAKAAQFLWSWEPGKRVLSPGRRERKPWSLGSIQVVA
jgi:hypothetical protein